MSFLFEESSMSRFQPDESAQLERYRGYLRFLADRELDPALRGRVDPSDLVQSTLLEAYRDLGDYRGENEAQQLAWLRKILAHNLASTGRRHRRQRRDVRRERSVENALERSSARLHDWLAADQSSPSERVAKAEGVVKLVSAVNDLPNPHKEIVIRRHWDEQTLQQIGEALGMSRFQIADHLRSALEMLRRSMEE